MLKTILHTFVFKAATALISLSLLVVSSRYLGAEGRGLLSLVLTGIGIIGMLNGFMGGSSLVFILSQRGGLRDHLRVLALSAAWGLLAALGGASAMTALRVIPGVAWLHLALLGTLANLLAVLSYALISRQKIQQYNWIAVLQSAITLAVFLSGKAMVGKVDVSEYLAALYCSYLACLALAGYLFIRARAPDFGARQDGETLLTVGWRALRYGMVSQAGLVIQFLNYRLSYFFLNHNSGAAAVGVFSVGAMLAESLWMLPGSMALVLYARVSSSGESRDAAESAIALSKLSLAASIVMLALLLLIPARLLGTVFGKDFGGIGEVVLCLAPGILALSYSMVISHYLAGIGLFWVNTAAAALGLAVTLAGNLVLVPLLGVTGAGLTASAAYLFSAFFTLLYFVRRASLVMGDLLPAARDFNKLKSLIS